MNTDELRAALVDQERFAPDGQAVVDELASLIRPQRRRPTWGAGLLAAAVVAGIVAGAASLAGPTHPAPVGTTPSHLNSTPAAQMSSAAPTSVTPTPALEQSPRSDEVQVQREAAQAESSAEAAASTAAVAAARSMALCNAAITAHRVSATAAIDSTAIRAVADGCAAAWGAVGSYTVEWVQTTLGKLKTVATGSKSQSAEPVVAIQVHAVFTRGGQSGLTETMLIRLFLNGGPPGIDLPTDAVNLAALGVVHRL